MLKKACCSVLIVMVSLTFVTFSCGLFEPKDDDDKEIKLNPKLKKVLYMGYVDPLNYLLNQGIPVGNVQLPVWVSTCKLYVNTWERKNGDIKGGLFEIEIDENTKAFKNYTVFEFPYYIRSAGFDQNTNKVFIIYNTDQGQFKAAYVSFSDNRTIIDEELVGAEWSPWGMTTWTGKQGIIFYGQNPQNGTMGFYWRYHSGQGGFKDSLLYSILLDQDNVRVFSISSDGKYLFFGTNVGSWDDLQVHFMKLDLSYPVQNPIVLAERKGGYLAIQANPIQQELVLLNYGGDPIHHPQAHIELFNLTTFQGIDLDVCTDPLRSRIILNQDPFWSTDGKHFAFSSSRTTGEIGWDPFELWIYENVP